MKNLPTTFLLAIALFFVGLSAHAFTVDLEGTRATGISDLDIGGTAYDVTFQLVPANTANTVTCAPAVPCDFFFGDRSAAQAAVTAIAAALNPSVAITVGSAPGKIDYFVPYATGGGNVDAAQGTFVADTTWFLSTDASLDADTDIIEYARFSAAVVPIPAAVWLFGSALGILGWVRRRTGKAPVS